MGESRWWRSRRTWNSSLPTNAARIHLQMEQFSQSTCWTLAEDLRPLKGQERFLCNKVGWKKEEGKRKRRGRGTGPAPLAGSWRREEVPTLGEAPSLVGRSVGTERQLWELSEESAATGLWQAGQSETYTDGPYHSPACLSLRGVSTCAEGARCWNMGFGEQTQGEDCCWLWGDSLMGQE